MTGRLYVGFLLVLVWVGGFAPPACSGERSGPTAVLTRILNRGKWTRADGVAVRQALRQGASLRTRGPRGVTLLMFAARSGDLPLMRAALRAGNDANAQTAEGLTPLWFVMATRNVETLRFLLDHGAQPDLADTEGRTPLMLATHFKFRAGIELLIARGADVNARNGKGHTALAYTDAHPGITSLLHRRGAVE